MFAPKRKRHHRRRRRNPGLPSAAVAIGGALLGTGLGVGTAYGLDKIGISTPTVRAWGMVGLGLVGAVVAGMLGSGAGAGIGAGISGVGLSRAILPATGVVAPNALRALVGGKKSIKGLGAGTGDGDGMIDADEVELVELVEGADDVDGAYDEIAEEIELVEGADDVDGAYDEVGGAYEDA